MRIVHIEAGRHLYGGAAQVRYLIDGLAAAKVDNILVCARGGALAAAAPAGGIVTLPIGGDLDVRVLGRFVRVLRRMKPDLVHVHSRRGADVYGGIAAALAAVPAVLTRRVDAEELPFFARLKYRPYRAIVALSRAIETQLAERVGVARARLARIPSAVDSNRYRPDTAARGRLLRAFDLPDDALIVGIVAQLIERKGHGLLFAQLPELLASHRNVRVVCFGRGPLEAHLQRELARLQLGSHVQLAGFRDDLPQLLPGLDVLVHPAAREGLGVALLEAASAGVPVVACAAGGVVDVIEAGRTGLLVGCHDGPGLRKALERLLGAPAQRRRFGAAGRARVEERFSVAALVGAHLALYDRVANERGVAYPAATSYGASRSP
jgi:glycosyltransferase involved in cell wall biosynthesis